MITSGNKFQNKLHNEILKNRILQIGAGEIDMWKTAVTNDDQLFAAVYKLIYSNDHKLAWRSGWIIDNASEKYPEKLADNLPEIISQLEKTDNSSLKRIFTRILSRYEIPDEFLGRVVNRCYELLSSYEPVAVRVNAMQILDNIAQQEQDMKQELVFVLESLVEECESAGFLNRAEKIIKKLRSTNASKRQIKPLKLYPKQKSKESYRE